PRHVAEAHGDAAHVAHAVDEAIRENEEDRVALKPTDRPFHGRLDFGEMIKDPHAVSAAKREHDLITKKATEPGRHEKGADIQITLLCQIARDDDEGLAFDGRPGEGDEVKKLAVTMGEVGRIAGMIEKDMEFVHALTIFAGKCRKRGSTPFTARRGGLRTP